MNGYMGSHSIVLLQMPAIFLIFLCQFTIVVRVGCATALKPIEQYLQRMQHISTKIAKQIDQR
jgi:hypothetical protein